MREEEGNSIGGVPVGSYNDKNKGRGERGG
jgi:hypothetical protein